MKCASYRADRGEVSGAAVGMVLRAAGCVGVKVGDFLSAAGISRSSVEKKMPLPPVSRAHFSPIYKDCMAALRERAEALSGRSYLSFDGADLLCACVLNCQKLEDAIYRTIKFIEVINGKGVRISLEVMDRQAALKIHAENDRSMEEMICNFIEACFYYKLFSWLIAEPLADVVELAEMQPLDGRALEEMMGGVLRPGQSGYAFIFKKDMLKRPVVRTSRELDEVLKMSPIELLSVPPAKKLSVILTGIFRRSLEEKIHIPQVDEVAYQLGQSGPTLRRHLAKENTSFQELVDKCRMEKASELLKNSSLTIDDISYHLGFSAPSGFSRAFKDWTGCAPSIYRQQQNEVGEDQIAVGFR